jgi:Mg-chelatase subunit ChlD
MIFGNIFGVKFFEPQMNSTATYIERDVVLVIDRSGSMTGQKFADLTDAINVFVQTLLSTPVQEQVGLASYSSTATVDVPLTTDLNQLNARLATLRTSGFTSISAGMEAGKTIIDNSRAPEFVERTMIVMTDGLHNRGPEPRGVARVLAGDGVRIHTITFGNDADQTRMQEIATIGSGRHFHAVDGNQLRAIYREIALTLSTMITE